MSEQNEPTNSEEPTAPKSEAAPVAEPSALNAPAPAEPEAPAEPFVAFDPAKMEVPEGLSLDEKQLAAFGEFATMHKLSHEAASALVSEHLFPALKGVHESVAAAVEQEWATTQEQWTNELNSAYGGKDGVRQTASKFAPIIDKFGGQSFREALDVTGFGNHPAAFAFFAKLSEVLAEGGPMAAGAAAGTETNPVQALYPTMFKK